MAFGRGAYEEIHQSPFHINKIGSVEAKMFATIMTMPVIFVGMCLLFRAWLPAAVGLLACLIVVIWLNRYCADRDDPQAISNYMHGRRLRPTMLAGPHIRGRY